MAYRLTSGGTAAKYVTIPSCSLAGDFDITLVATQAGQSNGTFLFAGTGVAGQNGLDLYRNISGKYQVFADNTSLIAGTINASNNLAAPDTIRISRVSGVVTLRVNGVVDGTASNSNTLRIDRFFHRIAWAHYGNMAFYTMSITAASGNRFYDASASGGTGTSLPDTTSGQNGTLFGFSVPADWVFYSSGSSFSGTIGKTSLSSVTKQLSTSLGYSVATGKSSATLNTDQLDISLGYSNVVNISTNTPNTRQLNISVGAVLGVGKQSLILNTQQESTQLGYVNVLSKQEYTLLTKQLSVVVGANLPFTGVLNKTTYSLSGKQLDIVAGWNSGLNIQSLNVDGKQESANLGYVVDINELSIPVIGKPFSIQTGTSISFIGELSKSDLNIVGKPLSVDAGTVIPFIGLLGKTSLSLSGKALSRLYGQILDIQKQSVSLVTKQLSVGEVVYPIIPVERLFTFTDKGRTYLFKQTTNVYLLTNKNNTYLIKGK